MIKQIICIVVAGMLLGGCMTNKPRPYEPDHSKAWNVVRAAGLAAPKDTELPDGAEDPNAMSLLDNPVADAVYLGLAFTGPTGGVDPFADLAIRSLELLTRSGSTKLMFAWMPKEMAASEEEAQLKFAAILNDAAVKTMNERGNTLTPAPDRVDVGDGRFHSYTWTGADCNMPMPCQQDIEALLPEDGFAPEVLGGTPAYQFGPYEAWAYPHYFHTYNPKYRDANGDLWELPMDYLLNLSANLPDWIYFFLKPGQAHLSRANPKAIRVPLVVNQGRIMYFIAPTKS